MAHRAEIIPALPEHIGHIAANVRDGDRLEFAANWRTARHVMEDGLRISRAAWTGTVDGVPLCMFGVAGAGAMLPDHGRPWMVGTTELDRHAVLFLRRCRAQVEEMLRLYPILSNYVAASNVQAIEWLRWLGFTVSREEKPLGLRSLPFLHFELRRST